MTLDIFWLHAAILAVISVVTYRMHLGTLRLRARFNLFRVRDKFVMLVADGHLDEENLLFRHYYNRINGLLHQDKHVGIDDILQLIFRKFKDGDFERIVEKSSRKAAMLAADPAAKNHDVCLAVADYYRAIELLILSHSSVLRTGWILSQHIAGRVIARFFAPIAPSNVRRGWVAMNYAEKEAETFSRKTPCCV